MNRRSYFSGKDSENIRNFTNRGSSVVLGYESDSKKNYFPPAQFDYRLVSYSYYGSNFDIALLRIEEKDLESFRKWTFPLRIAKETPESGERVYAVGYPHPYYSQSDLRRIENETSSFEKTKAFSSEIAITTGILSKSTNSTLLESNNLAAKLGTTDKSNIKLESSVIATHIGMSGAPWLNKQGEIIGSHISSEKYSTSLAGEMNDYHNKSSTAQNIAVWIKQASIRELELDTSDFEMIKKMRADKEEEISNLVMEHSSRSRDDVAKKVQQLLQQKKASLSISSDYLNKGFGVPSSPVENNHTYCLTHGEDRKIIRVHEIQIEIVNEDISKIRYQLPYISPGKKRFLWFRWGEDGGWSPFFEIPTAFLVENIRLNFEGKVGILDAFLENSIDSFVPNLKNYVPKVSFSSVLLSELLSGIISPKEDWMIKRCGRNLKYLFPYKDFSTPYEPWVQKEIDRWDSFDSK